MESMRWTNGSQPNTLQIAVFLLYAEAVITLIFGGLVSLYGILMIVGFGAGGFGIANEKRWGYFLAIGVTAFRLLLYAEYWASGGSIARGLLDLLFLVALFALLLHPESRSYQRIWFK